MTLKTECIKETTKKNVTSLLLTQYDKVNDILSNY